MPGIMLLDKDTINRIAAGEVIERPASVVKELLENAIDSGASSITIEIKDGGNLLIRVTDNGCGIDKSELKIAFLRHATSKIKTADDLMNIRSLGFRGEALSSISAIARTEIISKISTALAGTRYVIDGGCEGVFEEVAAPNGTTIIIRDIFFNTPARRKFLRTGSTEASHIIDLVEKIALSHPDIAIRLISNNQNKLQTMGNGNLKEIIYHIFGRDITSTLIPIDTTNESGDIKVKGFIAKPESSRSNRNYENYFINNRFIKSSLLNKAIEDGYSNFMMQHQYPFTVLMFEIVTSEIDINVHPTKMEIRFLKSNEIYEFTTSFISKALKNIQLIRNISLDKESDITISDTEIKHEDTTSNRHSKIPYIKSPEPFEVNRITKLHENESTYNYTKNNINTDDEPQQYEKFSEFMLNQKKDSQYEQVNLLSTITRPRHKLIGQAFSTYWIVELEDKLYIIDQHAAHEKVNYEKLIHQLTDNMVTSQLVNPPIILTLSDIEASLVEAHIDDFKKLGFDIEHFGGKEYAIRSIPDILPSLAKASILMEMIGGLSDSIGLSDSKILLEKAASMACKASVKGNQVLSYGEADKLIDELLKLDNPYNCPHGRPTIIELSKNEIEKKFKRIL